jgi:hypothetical protein
VWEMTTGRIDSEQQNPVTHTIQQDVKKGERVLTDAELKAGWAAAAALGAYDRTVRARQGRSRRLLGPSKGVVKPE